MEVRTLQEGDWGQYRTIRLLSLSQSPQSFENSAEDESSLTNDEWIKRVKPCEDAYIAGAFEGSTLIGIAGFARARKEKTRHKSYLWGVFVEPNYRRSGIATKLLGKLLRDASAMTGVSQIQLAVSADNVEAIALYKKFSFTIYGTETDAIRIDGRPYDEQLMAYMVNPE